MLKRSNIPIYQSESKKVKQNPPPPQNLPPPQNPPAPQNLINNPFYNEQDGGGYKIYNNRKYKIYTGKRGGKYICVGVDKKKVYI